MNLFRIYIVSLLVLILCTVDSKGSIVLALLLKLIALKGALFIGTPIALGSFLVGQGVGFFAGNLAGGYAVLKAAQKYHEKEKAKWKSPPVKTHFKGHGWNGWKGPKYSKGYAKGFGVGNAVAQLINQHKYTPSYQDYYDDGGGYYESSYGFTAGGRPGHHSSPYSPVSSSGYPSASYGYSIGPSESYGGYASPSYSYYAADYAPPTKPSLMDKLMSKLPTFLGGKSKGEGSDFGHMGPYTFTDGSYAADYGELYSSNPPYPVHAYAPYQGTPAHLPGDSYSPPKHGAGESEQYSFSPYDKPKEGGGGSETLFEDSEYTYSSSPYAKPQPKHPFPEQTNQGYESQDEIYPGSVGAYDGPAKEYTGTLRFYGLLLKHLTNG